MSTLTLTLLQADILWENKAANLARFEEKLNNLAQKTEIVVLPEMFNTGFSMRPEILAETMEDETVAWMRKMAATKKIILTGSLMIGTGGQYFNRLVWMLPNGQHGCYDKRHLFGYGEEDQHYAPGGKRLIASVKGWRVNLQVCYDLRFPVWARNHLDQEGLAEYDALIYVANWPERRSNAWRSLLVARAIENQCYVIGVNRVGVDGKDIAYAGDSMVIDPLGEILYRGPATEEMQTVTLDGDHLSGVRSKYPFLRDADRFSISV